MEPLQLFSSTSGLPVSSLRVWLLGQIALVLALVGLGAGEACASQWTKDYSIKWALGDNESRAMARRAVLQEARQRAASEIGAFVLRRKSLRDDVIRDSVDVVSVSLVRAKVVKEQIVAEEDGVAIVLFDIHTEADDGELERQLEVMRVDQRKAEAIRLLAEQNATLRRQLEIARRDVGPSLDLRHSAELDGRIADLMGALERSEGGVRATFARGAILRQADVPLPESAINALAKFNDILDRTVVSVELGQPDMVMVPTPRNPWRIQSSVERVRLPLKVSWWMDSAAAMQTLRPYMAIRAESTASKLNARTGRAVLGYCLTRPLNSPVARQVARNLYGDGLAIELAVGDARRYILVAGAIAEDPTSEPYCIITSGDVEQREQWVDVDLLLSRDQAASVAEVSARVIRLRDIDAALARDRYVFTVGMRKTRATDEVLTSSSEGRWLVPWDCASRCR